MSSFSRALSPAIDGNGARVKLHRLKLSVLSVGRCAAKLSLPSDNRAPSSRSSCSAVRPEKASSATSISGFLAKLSTCNDAEETRSRRPKEAIPSELASSVSNDVRASSSRSTSVILSFSATLSLRSLVSGRSADRCSSDRRLDSISRSRRPIDWPPTSRKAFSWTS